MAEFTAEQKAAARVAFEERELGSVVESARLIRIKFDEELRKVEAADALVAHHRARTAAAHADAGSIPPAPAGGPTGSSRADVGAAALDATVQIREN